MTGPAGPIRQLGTHRKVVNWAEQREADSRLTLDAIVVPASRPAPNLDQAISLARAIKCRLLILCSRQVDPAEVNALLAGRSFDDAIVVNLPDGYWHELFDFRALASIRDELPGPCSYYATDLSTKRNVALALALMLGWRRIFFLDDDIRDIYAPDVLDTVSMLSSCRTAGMRVEYFPDNSAACHAHRATGGLQDVFISGAALAVGIRQDIGFFPDIYNEDWLFFFDDAYRGLLGGSGREVTQLRYNAFADPRRAAWQEFGDVLAEGLYALLEHGMGAEYATSEYWSYFLAARQRFLRAIIRRSDAASLDVRKQLILSVEAAQECSTTITHDLLERYVWLWRRDLRDWRRRVENIGQMSSLEVALKELGLELSHGSLAADIARPSPRSLAEEPPTTPYARFDLDDVLGSGTDAGRREMSRAGRHGGRNRQASTLPHHGPPGVQGARRLATALRAFWPGRVYTPAEASSEPDAASGAAM